MESEHKSKIHLTAVTLQGLEPVLVRELEALGAEDIRPLTRAVTFTGDLDLMYKCNIWLRSALRVLFPLNRFKATTANELYRGVKQVDWSEWFTPTTTFLIEGPVYSPHFNHTKFPMLKAKDAIVDQLREKMGGRRPSVNTILPDLRIHLRVFGDEANISLDSSGDLLNRRGYRLGTNEAPINEVLAAGMLGLAGYAGDRPFVDPMCGSGTIAIEAAMMAANFAPGLLRKGFGYQKWPNYNKTRHIRLIEEAKDAIREVKFPILASDKSPVSLKLASRNVELAGLSKYVKVEKCAFEKLEAPAEKGLLVMNPPYGERMEMEEIDRFYRSIGDTLKENWQGWEAWVITSNQNALRKIGMKPGRNKSFELLNGKLDCWYRGYDIFTPEERESHENHQSE
ncbi:MAG: class I SAM-dependent RNA methyltransferase [Bacteroidia bacterium]|nr:class I SAM-dependent RNA methyltransferase [Bacteroidia bacterium]